VQNEEITAFSDKKRKKTPPPKSQKSSTSARAFPGGIKVYIYT